MSDLNPNIKSGIFISKDAFNVQHTKKGTYDVKNDGGYYALTILKNEIYAQGINLHDFWINFGHGIHVEKTDDGKYIETAREINIGSYIKFRWSDSPLSTSCEKEFSHECIVQVVSNNEFNLVQILKRSGFAFGSWIRFPHITYDSITKKFEISYDPNTQSNTQGDSK